VASAAAVVAFVASVWMMTATRAPTDRGGNSGGGNVSELTEAEIYEDVVAATSADELTTDFELIDEDVAELESEMLASMDEPGEMFPNTDALIDATDDRLEELSTYDPFEGLGG
jgi:FMN-dependent NADH-azoreductase